MKKITKITMLKKRRIALGQGQKDLADKVSLAVSSIGGYERGENPIPTETANKLAEALSCQVNELFKPHKKFKGKWVAK